MKRNIFYLLLFLYMPFAGITQNNNNKILAAKILSDSKLDTVESRALQLLKGFAAGTSYGEIWIRDFNTFIYGSLQLHPKEK